MINSFAVITSYAQYLGIFLLLVLLAVILYFEIAMLLDAIKNKNISDSARTYWIIAMFLIHPFVAIYYYFTEYKKNNY